jgi:ParB family chromosome partitioning protein
MEEAFAYRKLQDEFGLTQAKVAERVGKSRAQVANTERLLTLPPRIQAALTAGTITFGHAKVILGVESQAEQEKLFDLIVKEGLPVRFAEAKAGRVKVRGHERRVVSPELRAYEQELIQALGAKVKVRGTRDRGVVEVVFYSAQELAALVRKLRGQS